MLLYKGKNNKVLYIEYFRTLIKSFSLYILQFLGELEDGSLIHLINRHIPFS